MAAASGPVDDGSLDRERLPSVSAVIAVFNGEATIAELVDDLGAALGSCAERHEIVLVDDGSRDGSWAAITEVAARRDDVLGVRLRRNYGEDNASLCGILQTSYDVVVTLDDDLQHPPSEVPRLLGALGPGVDLVYGVPAAHRQGRGRVASARILKGGIARYLGVPHARHLSTFRAFRRELRDGLDHRLGPSPSIDVLLAQRTDRIEATEVRHEPRRVGRSGYTLGRLVEHTMDLVTGYSVAPLRVASVAGALLAGLGSLLLLGVAVAGLLGAGAPLLRFVAAALLLLAGLQLLAIGLVGEYLAQVHQRLLRMDTWSVRETTAEA